MPREFEKQTQLYKDNMQTLLELQSKQPFLKIEFDKTNAKYNALRRVYLSGSTQLKDEVAELKSIQLRHEEALDHTAAAIENLRKATQKEPTPPRLSDAGKVK
jgi:hypothetical protein